MLLKMQYISFKSTLHLKISEHRTGDFTTGGCFPWGWLQLTFVAKTATKVDLPLIRFPLESPPSVQSPS